MQDIQLPTLVPIDGACYAATVATQLWLYLESFFFFQAASFSG